MNLLRQNLQKLSSSIIFCQFKPISLLVYTSTLQSVDISYIYRERGDLAFIFPKKSSPLLLTMAVSQPSASTTVSIVRLSLRALPTVTARKI